MSSSMNFPQGTLNDEFLAAQTLPYTAYEITLILRPGLSADFREKLIRCVVSPITIIRHGIRPGSVLPSIAAKSHDGSEFIGYACDYYATREDAQRVANASMRQATTSTATAIAV